MGSADVSIQGVFEKTPTPAPSPTAVTTTKSVKTGLTDTTTGAYCAVILLALAGLGALGFKRKFNK